MIPKDWRRMLQEIGGWNNELVSVPAGAVREIIEEVETLRELIRPHRLLVEQAVTISKRGSEVVIVCDNGDAAEELMGWLGDRCDPKQFGMEEI